MLPNLAEDKLVGLATFLTVRYDFGGQLFSSRVGSSVRLRGLAPPCTCTGLPCCRSAAVAAAAALLPLCRCCQVAHTASDCGRKACSFGRDSLVSARLPPPLHRCWTAAAR